MVLIYKQIRSQKTYTEGGYQPPTHLNLFPVEILDRRVILLDEATGYELHGEGGFANPAGAQYNDLEFAHFCSFYSLA